MSVTASAKTVTAIDLRETIATAIYRGRNGRGCKPWRHQPHSHREPYYADAVEVLAAISEAGLVVVPREPTEAMLDDGWDNSPVAWPDAPNGYDSGKEALSCIYRAMIAAQESKP